MLSKNSRLVRNFRICRADHMVRRSFSEDLAPTTDIRKAHTFDEKMLVAYLQSHNVISHNGVRIKQFANGQSNPTFVVYDATGSRVVVRKQPPGKLLRGAHAVDREFRVMSALQDSNVPVPLTRGFCSDTSILGTPFYFYDFVDGRFFKDPSLPTVISAEERAKLYHSMLDALARIHSVDIDRIDLGDFGARRAGQGGTSPYVLRQIQTWTKMYRATETETIADMDRLIAELAGNVLSFLYSFSVAPSY
jgi:aminoglycoside phosphotransferase (APT) family kinase protein